MAKRPLLGGLPGIADRATRLGGSHHLPCKRKAEKNKSLYEQTGYPARRITPPLCKPVLKPKKTKRNKIWSSTAASTSPLHLIFLCFHNYTCTSRSIFVFTSTILLRGQINWSCRPNKYEFRLRRSVAISRSFVVQSRFHWHKHQSAKTPCKFFDVALHKHFLSKVLVTAIINEKYGFKVPLKLSWIFKIWFWFSEKFERSHFEGT